ncbi:hypothetical protein FQN60_013108 [Etheostoma spectabile]|uniref:Uncharacterized protein n=1 Tax=Etheostoma spectabile TaxID=54343 RepID=A0A5J5D9P4_9PERO|nr:hypothetical protein FQN60_013108 [Etheostoma spectabile]
MQWMWLEASTVKGMPSRLRWHTTQVKQFELVVFQLPNASGTLQLVRLSDHAHLSHLILRRLTMSPPPHGPIPSFPVAGAAWLPDSVHLAVRFYPSAWTLYGSSQQRLFSVEGLAAQLAAAGHADEAVNMEDLVHGGAAGAFTHYVLSTAGTAPWGEGEEEEGRLRTDSGGRLNKLVKARLGGTCGCQRNHKQGNHFREPEGKRKGERASERETETAHAEPVSGFRSQAIFSEWMRMPNMSHRAPTLYSEKETSRKSFSFWQSVIATALRSYFSK